MAHSAGSCCTCFLYAWNLWVRFLLNSVTQFCCSILLLILVTHLGNVHLKLVILLHTDWRHQDKRNESISQSHWDNCGSLQWQSPGKAPNPPGQGHRQIIPGEGCLSIHVPNRNSLLRGTKLPAQAIKRPIIQEPDISLFSYTYLMPLPKFFPCNMGIWGSSRYLPGWTEEVWPRLSHVVKENKLFSGLSSLHFLEWLDMICCESQKPSLYCWNLQYYVIFHILFRDLGAMLGSRTQVGGPGFNEQ